MKAIMLHGPDDLRIDELPDPMPGPRDLVIRLAACGICGTDLSFAAVGGMLGPSDTPMALGHELSGTVAATGTEVQHLAPGQRVVVNPTSETNMIGSGGAGGFAEYLLVKEVAPGAHVFPIPDSLSFEEAALTEPLSVALHGVNRAEVGPGSRVAVFGAGPIGLGVVLFLRAHGVEDIVVFDMSEQRLERARALGAKAALAKEMTFATSLAYPTEFNDVLELLVARKLDVAPMISHRYRFDQFMEAFATARDRERSAKVMITFPREIA